MIENSSESVEFVVRAFKVYLKEIVKHSAIDFARKVKSNDVATIVYSELVDEKVSLSVYDEDAFFDTKNIEYNELENIVSDSKLKEVIKNLKDDEKHLLYLTINDYSTKEIAEILHLKEQTILNKKNILKNKIKKQMEDLNDENRDEQ